MTSFAFEPIYGSLLLTMAVAAVTVGVILAVTPPTESPTRRRWLISLRLLAAFTLLLAAFRPALFRTDNQLTEAALVIAVDTSRSMTLPDGDGNSRWETQIEIWKSLAGSILGLDGDLDVRLLAYDSQTRIIAVPAVDSLQSELPAGQATDISAAALGAMQAAEGKPLAGIVLVGDGTQTADQKGTGAQRVAETLNSLGVPLWTVPIGPAGGASASRDAAIESLPESYQVFAGNELDVKFQLTTRGMAGIDVPVRLTWIDSDGQTTEIANRQIVPANATDVASVNIPILTPQPGTYRLKAEAVPMDKELVTTNNAQVAFVEVRAGGGRILYLEGNPRLEQTFLRRSLRRFPDLALDYQWIPNDTVGRWPVDLDGAFEPGRYDIYIIGDLHADALGNAQLQQLADSIGKGAGLITLGGSFAYSGGGYADSPLTGVIPVRMDSSRARSPGGISNPAAGSQIDTQLTPKLSRSHPITDFGGESPSKIWNELPYLLGANRFLGPKVAPGIQVLLESKMGDPLMIIGEYGSGRVASLAFDSTWRWWRYGRDEVHRRFWRQLVLWLLSRENNADSRVVISMDARRFATDKPPEFRAEVQAIDEQDDRTPLIAEIVDSNGDITSLNINTESSSSQSSRMTQAIRGRIPELEVGFYRLRVRAESPDTTLPPEELAFQVVDESRELAQPLADPVYLSQLADLTANHGGASFLPENIDELITTIQERRSMAETPVIEKFRLGDGPFTGWLLFGIFAGALSTEWFLRRQWGLA
ncbi:MAG: hypothetical protein CBE00_03015 [Planctomycetaceae bacterium TMED240]|nr:hypothetical protein [Rhodopirellula sp.]OUX07869.1 MAG: hypothetical protein CBE00_03015 [Planctomycetaceae bacterium TMED240]